jgi:D-threo-aldose 1-dehydrogenase
VRDQLPLSGAREEEKVERRPLGRTGWHVTPICIGTSPLGLPGHYLKDPRLDDPIGSLLAVLDGPFNFIDTSNGYGDSEKQIGQALERRRGLPPDVLLATKVDPAPGSSDFSGRRVRASVAESLERLGLDRLELVHFHDPERVPFDEAMAPGGAVEALVALRDEGIINHLGVAAYDSELLRRYLETGHFEVVLSHNQFTLIEQSATSLFDDAVALGVAVLNAAPYGGGMLAKGPGAVPLYRYRVDREDYRRRAKAMEEVCTEAGVPLAAAALQFSTRDPRVTSTVVGISRPDRVAETERMASWPIPDDLWDALRPFIEGEIPNNR